MNVRRTRLHVLFVAVGAALALCAGALAHAQSLGTGTRAVRIKDSLGQGQSANNLESWIQLSYVIELDGTVDDVIVEDSFGTTGAIRSWVRDVMTWRHQPATWNSLPVEETQNQFAMFKDVYDSRNRVGTRVREEIEAVREMMAREQWDAALERLSSLQERKGLTLYEFAFLSYLRGDLESRRDRFEEAAVYLRRATSLSPNYLGSQAYYDALYARVRAEVGAGMHAEALLTIQQLKANPRYDPNTGISNVERQLIDIALKGDVYSTQGTIAERVGRPEPFWDRQLLRRSLAFSDIEGTLTSFEVRCERHQLVDVPSADKRVDLRPHWGLCRLYVFGEIGSRFRIHEYALALE